MKLKPGSPAPLFTLQSTEGRAISIADYQKNGQTLLLVFLRHLG